ncbi:MAG: CvpA family protein [Lachnospiraceae bacterium]|nr:CvpA family protein [Lachnospiraceae bacterium]
MEINLVQAAVILLFAVFIFSGWRRGFLKIVISFVGTIVIIIAVTLISPRVSRFIIDNTDVYGNTRQKVMDVFLDRSGIGDNAGEVQSPDTEPSGQSFLDDLNIPDILKNDLIEKSASEMYQAMLLVVIRDYISVYAAKLIINAGSFVGVYIALSAALWMIIKSSDLIAKIPVIKGINRLLGAAVGAAQALIIVWIFFFVIIMFLGNSAGSRLLEYVQDSEFLKFLFNNNFLFRFISK